MLLGVRQTLQAVREYAAEVRGEGEKEMQFVDFFAGIGGIRLGLEQAGHKCVGFCEFDKYARTAYEAMYDTESAFPKTGSACSLSDILETSVDEKYFLSDQQTARILANSTR